MVCDFGGVVLANAVAVGLVFEIMCWCLVAGVWVVLLVFWWTYLFCKRRMDAVGCEWF